LIGPRAQTALARPHRALLRKRFAIVGLAALALAVASCASGTSVPEPPPTGALDAYASAVAIERESAIEGSDDSERLDALRRAAELAPDWVPPLRSLDEWERERLRGHLVWSKRRARAVQDGASAQDLYLLGRLQGAAGTETLLDALDHDAECAWAHHALSVDAQILGRASDAVAHELSAFELARSPFERSEFGQRLYGLLMATGQKPAAAAHLETMRTELESTLPEPAAVDLRLLWIGHLLDDDRLEERYKGFNAGLALLRDTRLDDEELQRLVGSLVRVDIGVSRTARQVRIHEALAVGPGSPELDGGELLLGRSVSEALVGRLSLYVPGTPRQILARAFADGRYAGGVRDWLAAQPDVALGDDGLPREASLRRWAEWALELDADDPDSQLVLVERLLDAGWQNTAKSILGRLGNGVREGEIEDRTARIADLDRRARAIGALVSELDLMVESMFDGSPSLELTPITDGARASQPSSTDEILAGLERVFRRYGPLAGLSSDTTGNIGRSPQLRIGPIASVVIPNARYSARDVLYGEGVVGEPVPGVAAAFDAIGRFGLFGTGAGRGPDGTVLRRLWSEPRDGRHLGRPWSGTVVWCDGAEADGARTRGTGRVSGAALHEGYWIDVEAERAHHDRLNALANRWFAEPAEVEALLALAPPKVDAELSGERLRRERRRLVPSLGQSQRSTLALMRERRAARPELELNELIDLNELLEVVQIHEEGHLCDREQYLPLGRNLLSLIGLGLGELLGGDLGFERRVEYRAQAVALACVPDPRLALIELLEAAEVDDRLEPIHARAYTRLLEDFLLELDEQLEADPERFSVLDPRAYLLYQLHRLGPEDVRRVAVEVARSEGLVASGFALPGTDR
jgi:hypothetical protein